MSEWAKEKAIDLWHVLLGKRKSTDVAIILRALDEAEQRGAERERWECWHAVDAIAAEAYLCIVSHRGSHPCAQECADALNARGPMRKPEEE